MKKNLAILLTGAGIVFFAGCSHTPQKEMKPMSFKSIDLLDKYGINENALMKAKDGYIFVIPDPNGAAIYKLDKNYNLLWKKVTPILLDPVKTEVKNGIIYILGYDQKKDKVALVEYDLNGNLKRIKYYGKKYDLAKDFLIIKGNTYIAVTRFSPENNSDIVIYSDNNKNLDFSTPYMDNVKYIKPYKNGILIVGTVQKDSEDVLIVYKTFGNKTLWAKVIDLGMDEIPLKVTIKDNEIILKVKSTDHMGAEKEVTFTIDEKGNVKNVKKGIEFKQLPIKYRT
ncbi:hypothetical protein [Nautilia sp.]